MTDCLFSSHFLHDTQAKSAAGVKVIFRFCRLPHDWPGASDAAFSMYHL